MKHLQVLLFILFFSFSSCSEESKIGDVSEKLLICTWGDSLTAGSGGGGVTYPNTLQSLLGENYQVINCGIGGENSLTIAGRQGGIPMAIRNSIELPADNSDCIIGERTTTFISTWNGNPTYPLLQGTYETINNCIIDSVECQLGWTGNVWNDPDGRYIIRRVTPGEPITLKAGSTIYTSSMKLYRKMYANVFFIGQNLGYEDNEDLVAQYKAMIEFSLCDKYVILGLTSEAQAERKDLEMLMAEEFGDRYINLREYLSTQGLHDAGITPTQDDLAAMSEGKVPPSLLSDHVHFNKTGYELIGKRVYDQFQYLNVIK